MNRLVGMLWAAWFICWISAAFVSAEDYYLNDFEDKDDVAFWCCGGPWIWDDLKTALERKYFDINYKGVVSTFEGEKAHSGARSLKFDITLRGKGEKYRVNFWRGPKLNVPLDKPVYLSGYIYPASIPRDFDETVKLGWSAVTEKDGKRVQGNDPIKEMVAGNDGWIFFQTDVSDAVRHKLGGRDARLEFWYLHIADSKPFHGQRVAFYVDDLRISTEKSRLSGDRISDENIRRTDICTNDPYVVNYTSFFKGKCRDPHNLVDNSSFELGMKGWEVADLSYTMTDRRISSESVHGTCSLKISRPDGVRTIAALISQLMPVTTGETYTLSFYAKSDEPGMIEAGAMPRSTAHRFVPGACAFALSNSWQRYVVPLENIRTESQYPGLYSIALRHKGYGTVWIDAVQMEKGPLSEYCPSQSVELGITMNSINNVYHSGKPVEAAIRLWNALERDVTAQVAYCVVDCEKKVVDQAKFTLPVKKNKGRSKKIKLSLPNGYYKLNAILECEGIEKKETETSFGVISPISNRENDDNGFFGISGITPPEPNLALLMSMYARECGIKYGSIYNFLLWGQTSAKWRDDARMWARADRFIAMVKRYDMIPILMFQSIPAWTGAKKLPVELAEVGDDIIRGWYDYTYEVVRRYKDRVKHWIVWSEFMRDPIDVKSKIYIKLLAAASKAARSADPDAVIIGFGEDGVKDWDLLSQLEAHFKLASLDYVDVVGLDAYCAPWSAETLRFPGMIEKLKTMIKKYDANRDKDIWITEVGWRGLDTLYYDMPYIEGAEYFLTNSELGQAENMVRMHLLSLAGGIKKFMVFPFGTGLIHDPYPFSLLNYGGSSPKMAYVAYNQMVNRLNGMRFVKSIPMGKDIHCLVFGGKKRQLVVVWNSDPSRKAAALRLNLDPAAIKITNLVGTPVLFSGSAPIVITGSPLYFEGVEDEKHSPVTAFEHAVLEEMSMNWRWEKSGQDLRVTLSNNTSRLQDVRLSIKSPPGWDLASSNPVISLQSGKNASIEVHFRNVQFDPLHDRISIAAQYENGVAEKCFSPVPCCWCEKPPVLDGKIEEWGKCNPIDLGGAQLFEVEGSQWGGNRDLSASVRLMWDNYFLYIAAQVNDDVFANPYSGEMGWANDAIQIGFDPLNNASGEDPYGPDDCEFGVSLTSNGVETYRYCGGDEPAGPANAIKSAVCKTTNGVCYEIAVPWTELKPFNPEVSRNIRFNLAVMDNDGDERKHGKWRGFHQSLKLSDGIVGLKRPGTFKDLLLLP